MSMVTIHSSGVDWDYFRELVKITEGIPNRDRILEIFDQDEMEYNSRELLGRIRSIDRGRTYAWLYNNIFPNLRHSGVEVVFGQVEPVEVALPSPVIEPVIEPEDTVAVNVHLPVLQEDTLLVQTMDKPRENFILGLKTNLLYDLATTPNVGVEFYLGKGFTLYADWMYAWWKNDHAKWYWRIYGGELGVRKWFGKEAKERPLTGHHIGLYGQYLTYDFAFGWHGQIGGKPDGNLWEKANYGGGVEYGYSLPVADRLNLDFCLGVGYFGGEYHEYIPQDDCYVWQATKYRNWIGPTKAEISLVWLLCRQDRNNRKGGER